MCQTAETTVFDTRGFEFTGTLRMLLMACWANTITVGAMSGLQWGAEWYIYALKRLDCR
jgi:hypothetical protein